MAISDREVIKAAAKAKTFLQKNRYAVVATVTPDGDPQAATVYYVMRGQELYFITESSTRKFANMMKHPRVAIVVGFGPKLIGVQMEGDIELTHTGGDSIRKILRSHPALSKNPYGKWVYATVPQEQTRFVILQVRIEWVRYIDYRVEGGPFVEIPMNLW